MQRWKQKIKNAHWTQGVQDALCKKTEDIVEIQRRGTTMISREPVLDAPISVLSDEMANVFGPVQPAMADSAFLRAFIGNRVSALAPK